MNFSKKNQKKKSKKNQKKFFLSNSITIFEIEIQKIK